LAAKFELMPDSPKEVDWSGEGRSVWHLGSMCDWEYDCDFDYQLVWRKWK
jgi:hypothetical protein